MTDSVVTRTKGDLTLTAYRGDGSVMLAFNLAKKPKDFAGFAVKCTAPGQAPVFLPNRLNFTDGIHADTTPAERHKIYTPSNKAPYQKFRWIDFTSTAGPGKYNYAVTAMFFNDKNNPADLRQGDTVDVDLTLGPFKSGNLQIGYTRCFLSSQAYVDKFKNKAIRPDKKSITFDTKPFQDQYKWLGFHARELVFSFLNDCISDKNCTVDAFAYDLDEPDVIKLLVKLGKRLRIILDDAPLHTKAGAMEPLAKAALVKSAGKTNVHTGHFHRFSHDKVFIKKDKSGATSVLAGSANFSVRGLYVQANNVLVFDDPEIAGHYEEAFVESFNDMSGFSSSEIAEGWIDIPQRPNLPNLSFAFSPHKKSDVSLSRVSDAIKNAKSSVLFAIMELGGGGTVLSQIKELTARRPDIFSYGVTQSKAGTSLFKPGSPNGILTPFAFLKDHVPFPFSAEISGGQGQVIHDKFIVVDFNSDRPIVFTGSSNLASGGEESNGDNLIEIQDPTIAGLFAVQAMGLVDHFHFRTAMQSATKAQPLKLSTDDWVAPYYDSETENFRERALLAGAKAAGAHA